MTVLYYSAATSLFASGIFAGLSVTMNFVSVPCIQISSDPLTTFITNYNKASKIGVSTTFLSSAAHLVTWYYTDSRESLGLSSLMLSAFLYTLVFMMPTNNALFSLNDARSKRAIGEKSDNDSQDSDKAEVLSLVRKWNNRQWIRTTIGTAVFLGSISQILSMNITK